MSEPDPQHIPIQPVPEPILNSPYEEPSRHWDYNRITGEAKVLPGRRPAEYWYKFKEDKAGQARMEFAEGREPLDLVNALRQDVRRWREGGWENGTPITKELLRYWWDADRTKREQRRLFFCQLEAAETIIYLREMLQSGKQPRWKPAFTPSQLNTLRDPPADPSLQPLVRYCAKMATGSGKTVLMAMLITWAFCNRGRNPSDTRFPSGVLVCCPNLTVKERLQVLRPGVEDNYFDQFDMVPPHLRPLLQWGKVLVTNWHAFAPKSPHSDEGKTSPVIDKGEETDEAFARDRLGELFRCLPLMVLNDEAHHCYRPNGQETEAGELTREQREAIEADAEEATIWITGLDRINNSLVGNSLTGGNRITTHGRGIDFCVDLSATPFRIAGSGYIEGSPLPWIVSDFGLVDAIESGIVKIPRLPVLDTTGRPDPKYFRLWRAMTDNLAPVEKLSTGNPKPAVIYKKAEAALLQLAGQWKERFDLHAAARPGQEFTPPVMIVVCDNTSIAELFYRHISGETVEQVVTAEDVTEELVDEKPKKPRKTKMEQTVYGPSDVLAEFSNQPGQPKRTIRIDSKLLAQAESEDATGESKQQAAEALRKIVATVGKRGEPGEHVRCVVSVAMLTEGWDASNVTHILGVRAFGSQLLCEQVVGRGLRRIDYTPNRETGRLEPEYVDVYGIPFSVIPFKGRTENQPAPDDKPKQHVRALPERSQYEIRFPVVEGYVFALERNLIRCNVAAMPWVTLEPNDEPTATFLLPQVGYQEGKPSQHGPFGFELHDRQRYYRENHLQTIKFNIARLIVDELTGAADAARTAPRRQAILRLHGRHQLFPQVYAYVDAFVNSRVDFRGCEPGELALQRYVKEIVERFVGPNGAIRPNSEEGEPPLLPILNRYTPTASTASVDFKTTRACYGTQRSQINQVVIDTETWETSTGFYLEAAADAGLIVCYARNDHLGLVIPYEFQDVMHSYEPDWLVRFPGNLTLLLETKGFVDAKARAKAAAAQKWVDAVSNWGQMGRWMYHVNHDPHTLTKELRRLSPSVSAAPGAVA